MTEDSPTPPPPPPAGTPPPYPTAGQPKRHSAWFWIAIIGGCFVLLIPVLLIIAALAIPQMLKARKTADETSAIQTMRAIASAELSYNVAYPENGYACSLAALGGNPSSGAPTDQAAQLIDPTLAASSQKSGYTFTVTCGAKANISGHDVYTSYQLAAIPQTVGKTGDRGFCSDESGTIKYDPTGSTNCIQPIQ
jgi:type IV pilus assembly protein PilA